MTEPRCQDPRAGGPYDDWKDVPCGSPATTEYAGRPVCEDHREAAERREREAIAETFCVGVDIETLRRIAGLGGLKATLASLNKLMSFLQDVPGDRLAEIDAAGGLTGLLASHERLVEACEIALPYLASHSQVAPHTFRAVTAARHEALPFLAKEQA